MSIKGPDFIIAGAARSGTTSLYYALDRHKDIYMAKPVRPEPKFFSRENLYSKGIDWYVNTYFLNKTTKLCKGEKSTEYLESIKFPERVIKHFAHVKIIIILRDPVERTISNYYWSVRNGYEHRAIEEAIRQDIELNRQMGMEPQRTFNDTRGTDYLSRSLYGNSLQNLFKHIPPDQVLLINFGMYINSFSEVYKEITNFLQVSFDKGLSDLSKDTMLENKNDAERSVQIPEQLYNELREFFKKDNDMVNKRYGLDIPNGKP